MRQKNPKISVIMPAYNAELYIARAIESILNQTFQDFELIIVDDHSKDKTNLIANKYQKIDKRIRIYTNKYNLKISKTLNKAISLCKADIIARMDADDVSDKTRFNLQYRFLKTHPKVAIVGSFMKVIDGFGKEIAERKYPITSKEMKGIMFRYSPFAHPSVMYRKKLVQEFGGYDEDLACEDTDLWFKLGSKYDFANIPKYLLKYTLVDTASSFKKLRKIELDGLKIKLKAIKKYNFKPSLYDLIYNLAEYSTIWFMPPSFRIWLYTKLRSNRFI